MRYFFDTYEGHWARDDRGVDCRDERQARHQAVLALAEMARECLPNDGDAMDLKVRVRRGEEVVFVAKLSFDLEAGPALLDQSVAHSPVSD